MRIPNIMYYFRNQTQGPILRNASLIFIGLVTAIVILCFMNTNSTINYIWNKQHRKLIDDSHIIKRDFQLQIDLGLRILNTSRSFYEIMKHDLNDNICDGTKAICSGNTLQIKINQMYKVMMLMYQKLYARKNSLVFYLDSTTNQSLALLFEMSELKEMYNKLNMTEIIGNFQKNVNADLSYVYFFDKLNYFVSCLKVSPNSLVYTCIIVDHKVLAFSSNRTYFIFLNNQVFYNNYEVNISSVNSLIEDYIEYLASNQYIGYDDTEIIVDQCIRDYALFSQNGLFQCLYSRTKLWSFPVLFEQLYVVLPNLYYKKLSYFRQEYVKSNIKLIIIPDVDNCYASSKTEIDSMKQLLTLTMRYSVIIIIGLHLFFIGNRLFIKYNIVNKINKIGRSDQNQSQLISQLPRELKPIAQTIEKYQWVIEYSKAQPQNHERMLMEGLQIFSKEQYEYLSIIRYLFTSLISITQKSQKYLVAAGLYERFIDLEMNQILKQEEKINPNDINKIYELELNRIQCYDKYAALHLDSTNNLADSNIKQDDRDQDQSFSSDEESKYESQTQQKQTQKLLGIGLNQLFSRLQQYKQHIQIDQRLVERGVVLKIKLRYIYGIGNSFRLLQQLENSYCDIKIKNQVRYIYAIQLRKKKPLFDFQALEKLIRILKSSTTAEFKRKSLKLIIQILTDYLQQFSALQNQLSRICNYYNYKKKSIYIRKQFQDRNYQKMFDVFIKDIHTLFGKSAIDDKNISTAQYESSDNLYDSHLTSNNNMSFNSITYSFMKDLKQIAESSNEQSKFVIIYRNDLINSERQKEERRQFQGLIQSMGTFLHIIVVGTNLKQQLLNKNKLVRLLREKNNLIYIDLYQYDLNAVRQKLKPFIE